MNRAKKNCRNFCEIENCPVKTEEELQQGFCGQNGLCELVEEIERDQKETGVGLFHFLSLKRYSG
ncbi:MAG: hypothetical protein SFU98_14135 [Leptospiraceae bacterium]|nr:hypothetical protein [Leptospiraceae bacterium]